MKGTRKDKPRVKKIEDEMMSLKASQGVPHLEREMDQMRKIMDEMRENMGRENPVEDLVH